MWTRSWWYEDGRIYAGTYWWRIRRRCKFSNEFWYVVELPNLIEGLIKIDSLTDDYYTYDETTFSLIGRKNKRGYRLGDSIKVKVVNADKNKRTIDFEVANGSN